MNQDVIAQMRAVTLSREYGSGGGEMAVRLARRLGWQLIDHEIVVRVAHALKVSEAEAEARDEHAQSLLDRLLIGMRALQSSAPTAGADLPADAPDLLRTDAQAYTAALRQTVEGAVAAGKVVIVGRGSQVLLGERRDVLHVRVVAPLGARVAYVVRREGLDEAAARDRIQNKDRDRIRYLQAQYNRRPADAHLYDLVVNTAFLDLESAVDLICLALERKAARLSARPEELGPAAGMAAYPGAPADLRPPAQAMEPTPEAGESPPEQALEQEPGAPEPTA